MLLVDTNIWLAAGDRRSTHHPDCSRLLARHADDLAAPVPVIAKTSWLLLDRGGADAQLRFVSMIINGGLRSVDLTDGDWARVLELLGTYADLPLDVIDASIVAIAERLGITAIATLNQRDFRVVRPRHVDSFDLVP